MVHESETTSAVSRNNVAPRGTVQKCSSSMMRSCTSAMCVRERKDSGEHDIVPTGGGGVRWERALGSE